MNERVQEYMINAERHAEKICGFCGHPDYNKIRNEEFAQLIVQDCIAKLRDIKQTELPLLQGINETINELPLSVYIAELKIHYGVK